MRILYVFLFLTIFLSGCASAKEVCKGFLGVSTKVLEDGRKDALKKEIGYDLITCHNRVRVILKEEGCVIYADDLKKDMLAVYLSEEDTTPVGVFLTEKSGWMTLIEVSSPSTYAKEKIAKLLFETLTMEIRKKAGNAEKGQVDATQTKEVN